MLANSGSAKQLHNNTSLFFFSKIFFAQNHLEMQKNAAAAIFFFGQNKRQQLTPDKLLRHFRSAPLLPLAGQLTREEQKESLSRFGSNFSQSAFWKKYSNFVKCRSLLNPSDSSSTSLIAFLARGSTAAALSGLPNGILPQKDAFWGTLSGLTPHKSSFFGTAMPLKLHFFREENRTISVSGTKEFVNS